MNFNTPNNTDPVVTANKYITYKKSLGYFSDFEVPNIVLICYQQSTLDYFLNSDVKVHRSKCFPNLYFINGTKVAILGGWGIGAPTLAIKVEQLIALGVNKFVAVGTAGTLQKKHSIGSYVIASKALAEDGVAHHYLEKTNISDASKEMLRSWGQFMKDRQIFDFYNSHTWSFSAIYRESPADILRVTALGFDVVEMEAATLYAIGKNKNVNTLSLFVISDSLDIESWAPHIIDPIVKNNLHKLAIWALDYCFEISNSNFCVS